MESPNLVKVVAAFVSGVVIALGSALIYVRVSEMIHPEPLVLAQSSAEAPPPVVVQLPEKVVDPPELVSPAPAPVQQPEKPSLNRVVRHKAVVLPAVPRKPQPTIAMAQLAAIRWPPHEPVTYAVTQVEAPPPDVPVQSPSEPGPHVVTLQAGTALPIRLSENLSADHNYTGDTFRGTLAAPLIMDGFIIADRGSKVLGRVVNAEKAGLTVALTEINTTDGQRIQVETSPFEQRTATSTGGDAAKIAGGAALGAIVGAIAGGGKGAAIGAGIGGAAGTGVMFATRSKAATLPVESKLTFRLATPLTITEKLN